MKDFKIVKGYLADIYSEWTTKEPENVDDCWDVAYFIEVDGYHFKLGSIDVNDNYYMEKE